MVTLLIKLVVTPLLVGAASLAGRHWGPSVSGWLVALPLTSGPIVFFLTLSQGPRFGSLVAAATLTGAASQAVFCLGYSHVAFAGFFLVLATLLDRVPVWAAFGAALVVALVVQGVTLWLLRMRPRLKLAPSPLGPPASG